MIAFKYASDASPDWLEQKQTAETAVLGTSIGMTTSLTLNKRWLLSTGLMHHQTWSKFQYDQESAIQISKEDHLIRVWIDEATGDTIRREYGDVFVDGTTTRQIVHYNEYKRFHSTRHLRN